jgi:hypothetical protein
MRYPRLTETRSSFWCSIYRVSTSTPAKILYAFPLYAFVRYRQLMHTQMTPLNLAVVFAPTIMRPMDIQRELTDVSQQRIAVQALLENYKTVFGEE